MQADIGSQRIPMDPQLYKAASEGDINLLESLLRAERLQQLQQPIHATNRGLQLHRAANEGYRNPPLYTVVGNPVNRFIGATYSGDTILHIAAGFGHLQVARRICSEFRILLLRGNNKAETSLHYAARAGKQEVVDEFIRAARQESQIHCMLHPEGVDVLKELLTRRNRDGETALYQAVHNKHSSVVEIMINADPHLASIPDNNNISPLYLAAMRNSPNIVTSLIASLKDIVSPQACSGPDGQTALHIAAAFGEKGIVQNILNWKPDLARAKDDTGSTPLHYAASTDNIDAIELLLENDKTPAYIADSCGLFPVHVAVKLGHLKVVTKLFELCPDSDELLDAQGRNFLHIAVEKRKFSVVCWARKNGKFVRVLNAKDDEGNTPMHLAVIARHLLVFALLLESKRLDLGAVNKEGLTPRDLARAQLIKTFFNWQSRDFIIYRTLMVTKSREGIRRRDHFLNEYKLEGHQKKIEREADNYENMAKNTSTVSVLIASASFAGIFTVSAAYKTDFNAGNQSSGLNLAFKAFILTVAFAFICSITATGLFMFAAMTYIDPMDRRLKLLSSMRLVQTATKGLVIAFALGAYVILAPVSKWLATLICLTGVVVPILINPLRQANIMISWALLRSIGWKELWRIQRKLHRRRTRQATCILFGDWVHFFGATLIYGFIVLLVLLCSIDDISQGFPQVIVLSIVMVPLCLIVLGSWLTL